MIYNEKAAMKIGNTIFYNEKAPGAQGDLFIIPVDPVADEYLQMDSIIPGAIVLALGEATGHAHAIYTDDEDVATIEGFTKQAPHGEPRAKRQLTTRYKLKEGAPLAFNGEPFTVSRGIICLLRIGDVAPLSHDEHSTHMLTKGDYIVIQQHELRHGEMVQARD